VEYVYAADSIFDSTPYVRICPYGFSSGDSGRTMRSNATTTEPTSLTIRVLEEITDNFSEERALGQGAYGKVYKVKFHPEHA
jgi:hypothetical protein